MDSIRAQNNISSINNLSYLELPLAVNISCIVVIMFIGIIGNALVFRVYARRPLTPQKLFLVSIATLDLFVILTCVPQIPFIPLYMKHKINKNPTHQLAFTAIIYTVAISCLGIMINMTIDRLWAVFRPFTYLQNWKRPMIILALCVIFGIMLFICARIVESNAASSFKYICCASIYIYNWVISCHFMEITQTKTSLCE